MDWTTHGVLTTVTGIDVGLWVIAYLAWRYLMGPCSSGAGDRATAGGDLSREVGPPAGCPASVSHPEGLSGVAVDSGAGPRPALPARRPLRGVPSRWAQRAAHLAKIERPATRRPAPRRTLPRAA